MPEPARIPPYKLKAKVRSITEVKNYNHELMNIPDAWKMSKGQLVTVGIMDTGKPTHDDLEIEAAWSAILGYEDDLNGHGTHVAGILAARENGRGVVGIAPECTVKTYTVLNSAGEGDLNGIIEAIYRAVEDGCDIINMSFGITSFNIQALQDACEEAASKGVIIVAAAGNEEGVINQPAMYDCVIAIGAVTREHQRASFSNFGKELDFAVGGVDIYSTYLDNGYAKMSGTSMACPAFSGLCAVILGEHKGRKQLEAEVGTPINGVQDMIEHVKRFAFDVGPEGLDEYYGHGIPIFQVPDEAPEKTSKEQLIEDIDAAILHLGNIKANLE